jgi:hypothetical protein
MKREMLGYSSLSFRPCVYTASPLPKHLPAGKKNKKDANWVKKGKTRERKGAGN